MLHAQNFFFPLVHQLSMSQGNFLAFTGGGRLHVHYFRHKWAPQVEPPMCPVLLLGVPTRRDMTKLHSVHGETASFPMGIKFGRSVNYEKV
jgi:hypothetical protein